MFLSLPFSPAAGFSITCKHYTSPGFDVCIVDTMSLQSPSIKDFFQITAPSPGRALRSSRSPSGSTEFQDCSKVVPDELPLLENARISGLDGQGGNNSPSRQSYDSIPLGSLAPGPRRLKIQARVVNIYDQPITSKHHKAAKGCLKIVVKDDTAGLLVSVPFKGQKHSARAF